MKSLELVTNITTIFIYNYLPLILQQRYHLYVYDVFASILIICSKEEKLSKNIVIPVFALHSDCSVSVYC